MNISPWIHPKSNVRISQIRDWFFPRFSPFLDIKSTWDIIKDEIDHIGMLAFLHLFKAHPEAKAKFKMFEDIPTDDLNTNEIFQNHAHRVVSVIRKIVVKLDDPPGYLKYLKILGSKHIMFDADVKYIKQMGYMFLSAIQPTLEKEVTNTNLMLQNNL